MKLDTRLQKIVGEYRNILVTDGILDKESLLKMLKLDEEIDVADYEKLADKILHNIEDLKPIDVKPYSSKKRADENRRRLELYNQELNDAEIAEMVGVCPATICNWRNRNGLPAHNIKKSGKGGRKKKTNEKV